MPRSSHLIGIFLLGASPAITAGEALKGDTVLCLRTDRVSPVGGSIRNYYTDGPSTVHFADEASISSAGLTADLEKFDSPIVVQEGTGHNSFGLTAESYYKLSPRTTVWGHAGYHSGTIHDVKFCDVIDYESLAPFVLMDDTGGDLRFQRYDFGGGWNRTYDRWSIGAQASYRAAIAHRWIDPRVRNIVSDLDVSLGAALTVGTHYMLGLDLGVKVYHQDTDVDFYNPASHAITMVYTGLGSIASRFKGADAQSSAHRMTGFNASLRLVPKKKTDSYYAQIDGAVTNADLILNGYNNLNFGTTTTGSFTAKLSRLFHFSHGITMFPTLTGYVMSRVSTENIFGSSADNYVKIGERKNYHHDRYEVLADIPVAMDITHHNTVITVGLKAGYATEKEYLVEPVRRLATGCVIGGIVLDATKSFRNHWSIGAQVGYKGRFVSSTSAEWGGLDLTTPEGMMCQSNYRISSSDISAGEALITLSRAFSSIALSLSAGYTRYDYGGIDDGNNFTAALSVIF